MLLASVTAVTVRGPDGRVKYYDGILEDITELRRAEEEARLRREELARLGRWRPWPSYRLLWPTN